ncbi:hypothetical protein AYI70_g2290 [Smittium culicis]|uniref:Uncharacterized protein n=1 Tax=Smittium culicis TaxID=133412 RepID=A0A1R1Y8X8_9FUNG|nr:hypothetical protein AYI70_g2290 [Smittium culicis]
MILTVLSLSLSIPWVAQNNSDGFICRALTEEGALLILKAIKLHDLFFECGYLPLFGSGITTEAGNIWIPNFRWSVWRYHRHFYPLSKDFLDNLNDQVPRWEAVRTRQIGP